MIKVSPLTQKKIRHFKENKRPIASFDLFKVTNFLLS